MTSRDDEGGETLGDALDPTELDWLLDFAALGGDDILLPLDRQDDENLTTEAQDKAQKTRPSTRRKRTWDPNRARKARAAEVQGLRYEVQVLEERLRVLKVSRSGEKASKYTHPRVWEAIWCKQLERRKLAEAENCRLLSCLQAQTQAAESLKRLMAQSDKVLVRFPPDC